MPLILFRIGCSLEFYEVSIEDLRQTIKELAEYRSNNGNPASVKLTLSKDGLFKELIVDDILVNQEDFY